MPSSYTHFAIAKEALRLSPIPIPSPRLYFFGSHGADFCFFYRPLGLSELNFGRFLHGAGGYDFFSVLRLCAKDEGVFSYALGYITHYAADVTFHPYVYAHARTPLSHTRMEGAIDAHFYALNQTHALPTQRLSTCFEPPKNADAQFYNAQPTKDELSLLYLPYALVCVRTGRAPLQRNAFFKAAPTYLSYLRASKKILQKPSAGALNLSHRTWQYPKAPHIQTTDGADELFVRSLQLCKTLFSAFSCAVQTDSPPPKPLFSKHFLHGV